jgi:hypothetical protein
MTDADLLYAWPLGAGATLSRFVRFFEALAAASESSSVNLAHEESLGAFNRRLARLHSEVIGRPVEAKVACPCGQELELVLPLGSVAATPDPPQRIEIEADGPRAFRLPRLSEVALAQEPRALARACALDGGDVDEEHLSVLEAAWSAADPAAEIALEFTCTACTAPIRAQADLALFVARDLDLRVRALLAEVHGLARAYGWTEAEVLAVPASRRRAYADLIWGQA